MTPRTVATVAAITSLIFGSVGLIQPQFMTTAFGIEATPTVLALGRLLSASYLGMAVLAWLARGLTDTAAWRAVAGANAVSWALSAVVLAIALVSGLGSSPAWALVAMQLVFTLVWSMTYVRAPSAAQSNRSA